MTRGFAAEELGQGEIERLRETARLCRGDILKMTTLAGSGHPGGSMSSIDIYLTLWSFADVDPADPLKPDRDRITVSHGHTSPGAYAALGRTGFFDVHESVALFRKAGSRYEGHVERGVPGIEWGSGNLGQGLSAAVGFALASRLLKTDFHVYCVMGDGEQQKGQIAEARRMAVKFGVGSLTAVIDLNRLQISGDIAEVMPQDIKAGWESDGWSVIEVNGHDFQELYQALRRTRNAESPTVIIADTVMGKGVSWMENVADWHGQAVPESRLGEALSELGIENDLDRYKAVRSGFEPGAEAHPPDPIMPDIDTGAPRTYGPGVQSDNRGAWGKALEDMAELNSPGSGPAPFAVFDCDLAGSVKTKGFAGICPEGFFQSGIQEHSTITTAGALSTQGVIAFFAGFGVFGVDETFNQSRLNAVNNANLKIVCTHCGLDVGEDGKTHQCVDYVGSALNIFNCTPIVPADPNQTDRVARYIAGTPGNFIVSMGRSKLETVLGPDGEPLFGGDYKFEYGRADLVREGADATLIAMGTVMGMAVRVHELLKERGLSLRVLNMACPRDLDGPALDRAVAETGVVATYEDHSIYTGLGAQVAMYLGEKGLCARFRRFGVDRYGESGKPAELFRRMGMDPETVAGVLEKLIAG